MAQKSSSSCFVAAIVAFLLVVVGVIALISLIFSRTKESRRQVVERHETLQHKVHAIAECAHSEKAGNTVVLHTNRLPEYSAHQAGKNLSREQFVAFCTDNNTTSLTRDSFQKSAQLSPVKWKLRTEDITERNGKLGGQLSLPYQIRTGNSSQTGTIRIECEFDEESRNKLLNIRRGDWVTIRGKLTFQANQKSGVIKEALIDDGTYAENPESSSPQPK